MRIIEPYSELYAFGQRLTPELGIELVRWVELNARVSRRSEGAQVDDSWQRFIQAHVMDKGDWSVTEHASVTAFIQTDRGMTHELVRHRLFSYTQESTRFINYSKKGEELEFVRPSAFNDDLKKIWHWCQAVNTAETEYFALLERGARPQDARSVLPNAMASLISMTGNLRAWRAFFMQRVTKETHPDFRRISIPMLAEFQRCIPILFADIIPEEKQSISMAKVR